MTRLSSQRPVAARLARPRIVVADGFTTNPGDVDWAPLEALGELTVYERTSPELVERCRDADVVLTNKAVFDARVLGELPKLRLLSVLATGTNVVDLEAAQRRGVVVCNVPGYSTDSVAQHTFALLLELRNHTADNGAFARDGSWSRTSDFSRPVLPVSELAGQIFGIVGFGQIGRRVAAIARAFGMEIRLAESHTGGGAPEPEGYRRVPLDELFRTADVVSLHCPLGSQTRGLVSRERLDTMKPTAILLNTGRGPLVDETALAEALQQGKLGGAGLDVLCQEPPQADHPLLHAPRCLVTPHMAWASVQARQRLLAETALNVAAFLTGAPRNVVRPT